MVGLSILHTTPEPKVCEVGEDTLLGTREVRNNIFWPVFQQSGTG